MFETFAFFKFNLLFVVSSNFFLLYPVDFANKGTSCTEFSFDGTERERWDFEFFVALEDEESKSPENKIFFTFLRHQRKLKTLKSTYPNVVELLDLLQVYQYNLFHHNDMKVLHSKVLAFAYYNQKTILHLQKKKIFFLNHKKPLDIFLFAIKTKWRSKSLWNCWIIQFGLHEWFT